MKNLNWVHQIEIELHNRCNLLCPLCVRQNPTYKAYFKKSSEIPIKDLIEALDRFPNLTKIHLVGNSSEPTLYSSFLTLVEYLKKRNISIMISSNMLKNNKDFWKKLSDLLTKDDEIRFAVDGSSQETYSRYRVNGRLDKVLENIKLFENSDALKVLQIIKFKENETSYEKEINQLLNIIKVDYVYKLNTNSEDTKKGLSFPKKEKIKQEIYINIFKELLKMDPEDRSEHLHCYSKNGFIYINHRGEFITCCDRYEEFLQTDNLKIKDFKDSEFNKYYTDIYKDIYCNDICLKSCNKKLLKIEHDRDHLLKDIK